ncbi:MAG: hypothetical protein J5770_03125 [Bacteroidaceae bacterium]|nr:hypothetical protein [Bacteroidaceae bacterium]
MKKFFTLIAAALVAGSAFAQEEGFVNVINNGDLSGTDMTNFEAIDYWDDGTKHENIHARIMVDGAERYIVVGSNGGDDAKFFITLPEDEALGLGAQFQLKLKVKAEYPATVSFQAEGGERALGNINITDEWTTFTSSVFTAPGYVTEGNWWNQRTYLVAPAGMRTIAFNLSGVNYFYFDDIELWVMTPNWKEVYSNDGTSKEGLSVKFFKNYTEDFEIVDEAIAVKALEPGVDYAQWYYMEDGDGNSIDVVLANEWDTQFLIPFTQGLAQCKKLKLTFKYKADVPVTVGTQAHAVAPAAGAVESVNGYNGQEPYAGTYINYQFIGNFDFDTEWKEYENLVTINAGSEENPVGSLCFNLNPKKDGAFIANTFYFKDIKVWLEEEDIIEVPTAINTAKAAKTANAIFNISGQKVQNLQKGLNIVDGKKVYVK